MLHLVLMLILPPAAARAGFLAERTLLTATGQSTVASASTSGLAHPLTGELG
jgi:hypothetical protein